MKNFKLKDLMVSIQPSKGGRVYGNNDELLYESPENWFMQNDACVDQETKSCSAPSGDHCPVDNKTSCSAPSGDHCPDDNKTSCSAPSGDCPDNNKTSCSAPSGDCPRDNRTSCSAPSGKIEDKLNFENDGFAIN